MQGWPAFRCLGDCTKPPTPASEGGGNSYKHRLLNRFVLIHINKLGFLIAPQIEMFGLI